jgi:hypothetical protein
MKKLSNLIKVLVITLFVLLMLGSSSTSANLINKINLPLVFNTFNEARVRYIITDSQLGGVIGYYRQFPDDPNAVRQSLDGMRASVW